MRTLRKLIFINSSVFTEAEIDLNGNISFCGTNNSGKTTIERAALFFYEQYAQKLGFSSGQSFNFYLQDDNSYLIYEIQKDDFVYMLCMTKTQTPNRYRYHFIDSPYKKQYFLDENGLPCKSWMEVCHNLKVNGDIISTSGDPTQADILDILFGKCSKKEYQKYNLIYCHDYTPLAECIASIYKNDKIKNSNVLNLILGALGIGEDQRINLNQYRSAFANFKEEMRAIRYFTDPQYKVKENVSLAYQNKQRFINSRTEAFRDYRDYKARRLKIDMELQKAEFELGPLKEREDSLSEEHRALCNDFDEFSVDRKAEIESLKNSISEIKKKYQEYVDNNYSTLLERVNKKKDVEDLLRDIENWIVSYNKGYNHLVGEIDAQIENHRSQHQSIKDDVVNEILRKKETLLQKKTNLLKEYDDAREEIEVSDKEILDKLKARYKQISELLIQNKASYKAIESYSPKAGEIKSAEEQIRSKEEQKRIKQQDRDTKKAGYDKLFQDREREVAELDRKFAEDKALLAQKQESLKESLTQYQEILAEECDTFSQMLASMGLDDEKLLSLSEDTLRSFVYAVERYIYRVFFPEFEIPMFDSPSAGVQVKIGMIKAELEKTKSDQEKLSEKYSSDEESLNKKFSSLKAARKEIDDLDSEIYNIADRLKMEEKQLAALKEENIRLRADHRKELEVGIDTLEKEMAELQEQESMLGRNKLDRQKALRLNYESNLQIADAELEALPLHQQEELLRVEEEYRKKLNCLEDEKNTILQKNGIDTSLLTEKEKKRQELENELNYIKDNSQIAQSWIYFLNNEYPTLESKAHELHQKGEEYEKSASGYKEKIKQAQEAVNLISKEILQIERRKEALIKENETQVEGYIKKDFEEFVGDFDMSYAASVDRTLQNCTSSLSENLAICREANGEIVRSCLNITSLWKQDNPLGFPVVESNDYMGFIDKIYSYVIDDNYKTHVSMINHTYILHLQNICREFREIYQIGNLVQKPVNVLNNELSHVNEIISTITSIKVKLQWKPLSGLDDVLYRASEYVAAHDINSLFSTGEETERYNEFLNAIVKYMDYNSGEDRDYIGPSDLFCLMFACSERGNPEVWNSDINRLGSSGNTSLTKWIVQLTLLDIYRKAVIRSGNEDFRIHCMMDEIGTIHSENMKPLIRYANERGIFLVTAVPDNIAGEYFDTCYKVVIKKENKYSDVQLSLMHKFKTKQAAWK